MNAIQGFGQKWTAYRPTKGLLFWAAAAGAVATIVVGFAWGGWVTGGGAKRMAEAAAAGSRDQLVAAVLRRSVPGWRRCPGAACRAEAGASL